MKDCYDADAWKSWEKKPMHDYHIELARHALGLNNNRTESYRLHFVAGKGHPDHAAWMEMVEAGGRHARRWVKTALRRR